MAGGAGAQPVYGQYDQASGGYTAIGGPQISSVKMIGTVTSGPPKITNPKTGELYPANYIPNTQEPGTHEMTRPGDALAEDGALQVARIHEYTWNAINAGLGPLEEKLINIRKGAVDQYGQAVTKLGAEFGKDPGKAIGNILGSGGNQVAKLAGQAVSSGQQLAGQAVNAGQQLLGQSSPTSGGGSQTPRMGGMTSALISKAPESQPLRGTSAPSLSQARSSYFPSTARRD